MNKIPKVKLEDMEKDTPLENIRMTITVEVERIFDPNRRKNNLMMTMGAAKFTDPNEKSVGEVLHGVPAHSVIRDRETKEDWVLNYGDLFTAYLKARGDLNMFDSMEEAREKDEDS
jgi:hypothetical protein